MEDWKRGWVEGWKDGGLYGLGGRSTIKDELLQAWVLGIAKLTDMAEYTFGILH